MLRKRIFGLALCAAQSQSCKNTQAPWRIVRQCAGVHSSCRIYAKVFMEHENQFAHAVLVDSVKPYQLCNTSRVPEAQQEHVLPQAVLDPPSALEHINIDELFQAYAAMLSYCTATQTPIADARFVRFTQLYCEASHLLSDEQLLESLRLLTALPKVESLKDVNFVDIWNNLDVECCRRIERWNSAQLLLACDAWYRLNIARVCDFVWEALRKLGRKVVKMSPEQLVQTMFLCNIMRRPLLNMFDFEVNLAKCAEQLTLQELGVMSMGFFKTQTPIRNTELIAQLYQRLGAELDTVEDITLVAILKVLRYSTKLGQADLVYALLDKLCAQVSRISLLSCLHAALLGSDLHCCHEQLLELVLQRFRDQLPQTRLKDLERICFVIGIMNYSSPTGLDKELSSNILQTLRTRIDEIIKHPRCFPLCLHFLTLRGLYDADMISSVLDARYIAHAYGKNMALSREIFSLDSFVRINLQNSNYEGHLLSDKQRASLGKILTKYIPERQYKLNLTDRTLLEIKETVDTIYKNNALKHILPHFERPDVIVCYDKRKRDAVPIASDCAEDYSGVILTREQLLGEKANEDIITVAIVIVGWNNVVRGKDRFTGLFEMKLEQLRLLGHKFVVIYWHEWRELETQKDRQNFIKRKLASIVKT